MTSRSETYDMGGLELHLKSLSLGHSKPAASGNLVYDGSDDSFTLPGILVGSTQTLTGAGAVNVTSLITFIVSTGTDALTLADGTTGQIKIVVMQTDGGTATMTPTNFAAGTDFVFANVGDAALLVFDGTNWQLIASTAGTGGGVDA